MRIAMEGKYVQREAATRTAMEQVRSAQQRASLGRVVDEAARHSNNEEVVHSEMTSFLRARLEKLNEQVVALRA